MKTFKNFGDMDASEFYNNDVSKHGNAHFDGNQFNGRDGSPSRQIGSHKTGSNLAGIGMGEEEARSHYSDAALDFNGVNFNTIQHRLNNTAHDNSPDMTWEKKHGVFHDPAGKFKDVAINSYEVDLKNDKSGGIGLSEKDNCHY